MSAFTKTATLRFTDKLLTRPEVGRRDALATLAHFAIISYAIDPERVRPLVHPRFEIDTFVDSPKGPRALVSMVPFQDQDFRFVGLPWMKHRFGQTNYRTYVIDRETSERAVWFFGTSLDSWSVAVPQLLWQLPWHRGRIQFECDYNPSATRYTRYRMDTTSDWAPVELELADTGAECAALAGVNDYESGLVALTHPLLGVFYRCDGKVGTYRIWHDRLHCTVGRCLKARIGLFDRLGLVPFAKQLETHSVLIQPRSQFAIYLPPREYVTPA